MSIENPDLENIVQEPSNAAESTANATPTGAVNNSPMSNLTVAPLHSKRKRENLLDKCSLAIRVLCSLLSFLSFVIMASNKQLDDEEDYSHYPEYKYLMVTALLAWLYCMVRVAYQVYVLSSDKVFLPKRAMGLLSFGGDQVIAYALLSALSVAIPNTTAMRQWGDDVFTDMVSASISMAFLAFAAMASSALISGFKLSTQIYI